MKITDIKAECVEIPFKGEFRPTWYPGGVEKKQIIFNVRVLTDEGIEGIASAEAPFGIIPVMKATVDYLKLFIVNESPFEVERLIYKFRNVARIATRPWLVENALWDIIGKAGGQPVYRLFGAGRSRVPVYAAWGEIRSLEQRREDAQRLVEEGFKAVKLRFHHEKMTDDIALVEAVRKAVGDKLEIMVDANQGTAIERQSAGTKGVIWSYRRALETARALYDLGASWLEEPLFRYDFEGLARLTAETELPIAGGEINRGIHEFNWMLQQGVYDILQPNCTMSEGMSQIRKIAALADSYGKLCNPHAWIPGVGLIASLHLAAAIPNLTYLEYPYDPPVLVPEVFQGVLKKPVTVDADGCVAVPEGPGFGVEFDEDIMNRYRIA